MNFDSSQESATKGLAQIEGRLNRLAEKGKMTALEATAAIPLLPTAGRLEDLAICDTVVEATVEEDIKRLAFCQLEEIVSTDYILASNTSSISIASACQQRTRIAGLHFFNPAPLMPLVEVIRSAETSGKTDTDLIALSKHLGHTPVRVNDSPGFLVNMGGRAIVTKGIRLLHESVANPEQVDTAMRDCFNFRMGPFELMDLTGIDVNYPVSHSIWENFNYDPRIAIFPAHKALLDANLFGHKSGRGWFDYTPRAEKPSPNHVTSAAPVTKVALAEDNAELVNLLSKLDAKIINDDGRCPILAAPVGEDATSMALRTNVDHTRLVCIDPIGNTDRRITIMTAPGAGPVSHSHDSVAALLATNRRNVTTIKDNPDIIGQRIAAMITNLGCYIAETALSAPNEINMALELDLNYPVGPLKLGEQVGAKRILIVLTALQHVTGDDQYRPNPWLSRRARLNLPLTTAA